MRYIHVYISLILYFTSSILMGQCIDSDDPALNNAKNIKTIPGSTVNIFDWRAGAAVPLNQYTLNIIGASNQTSTITRFNPWFWEQANINTRYLQDQPINNKDFEPTNGWDLVTYYFGGTNDPKSVPYIILYNRYRGILRTFFFIPKDIGFEYNAGRIQVEFIADGSAPAGKQIESALLTFSQSPFKAVDKFDKKLKASAPIIVNSEGNFWLYADFPMAYDPCTCNYISRINVKPILFKTQQVELIQDDISKSIITPTSASGNGISPVISGFNKDLEKAIKTISAVGKTLKSGIDLVEGIVPANKVTEITTKIVPNGVLFASDTATRSVPFKFPSWFKQASGIFGSFLGVVELLSGEGDPTPVVAPKGLKYKISGTISTEFPLAPADLFVPGSNWPSNTGTALTKPLYNNTLGVFSLVETPRINYNFSDQISTGPEYSFTNTQQQTVLRADYRFIKWDFQLQDDIRYAINPASGYSPTPVDIKAALVFNVDAKCLNENLNSANGAFPPFCTFSSPISSSCTVIRKKNANGTLSDTATITTPLMPLSCIRGYVAHLGFLGNTNLKAGGAGNKFSTARFQDDVRLLIMANLQRTDDPTKQYLFEAQYQLFPTSTATAIPNTPISDIQLNPVFENLSLTSDLTIRAWEKVTFKGNVTTNGFKLTVIAGSEVNFENPANIPANADITIGLPTECQGGIVPPQSPSQLYAFCAKAGTKKYNPEAPASLVANDNERKTGKRGEFNISPNPFTNQITIDLNIEEATSANLDLSNAVGQTLKSMRLGVKEKGSYQETIETNDLAPGIYFLTLRTQNGTETKKIVKQ
jgi:Secretion system C-terminal sorting domain